MPWLVPRGEVGLSERARQALDELLSLDSVQPYATRDGAHGKCHAVSTMAAQWFRAHGVDVQILRFSGPRITTYLSELELAHRDEVVQHVLELEHPGLIVDLTWRMWEPEGPFPRFATIPEYLEDFAAIDNVCGTCAASDRRTCTHAGPLLDAITARGLGCTCPPVSELDQLAIQKVLDLRTLRRYAPSRQTATKSR
jgi:hypothetical protein